ncbi:LysE family translocator [Kutzneria viridogrisea]|uniref:Threonine/homoserine/homoserine lactone efflux protein n=1 Tax=Kutzneria viridogrisea TaxID=47990 RepID=A0ABR6BP86_9PSEU|nr:threonine/homoserine/homoserine lactone efflux protein [Kutzneria viridogrisea]
MISAGFLLSSLLVIMTPGPDLLLITRMLLRDRRQGPALAAAAGMITAGALHAAIGLAGLALLLQTEPWLFTALRWVGAAVLFGWGVLTLRSALRTPADAPGASAPPQHGRAFWQGLACTGSNPKVGLFLVAFLPQFVPTGPGATSAVVLLAAVYLAMGLAWLVIWIQLAHWLSRYLVVPSVTRAAEVLLGLVFLGFGVRLLVSG